MQKILPDTNILIDWLNRRRYGELLFARGCFKYLSAVVWLELEAGAFQRRDRRLVEQLAQGFVGAGRVVTPTAADWQEGGRLLCRLQEVYGYDLHRAYSLTHDVLIALSARRIGALLITQNGKDFEAIRKLKPFSLLVVPA